jgi:F-type H+-transporting ATPase subunit a
VKNPRALLIATGLLAVVFGGFWFVRGPKPIIEIKGESLATWGDYGAFMTPTLLNTTLSGVAAAILIIALAWATTRNLSLIPRGLQNAVEGVVEAMYTLCVQMAGEKNARRFFPVAMSLFTFIWLANWFSLTPIFNSFGAVEQVNAEEFAEEAMVITNKAGIGFIFPFSLGGDSPAVEFEVDESEVQKIDGEIAAAKAEGATPEAIEALQQQREEALLQARELAIEAALPKAAGLDLDYSSCEREGASTTQIDECEREINIANAEEARAKMQADGKKLGIIKPYFRSFNTDLNSPLSLAIVSVSFIEFWGITALGFFKYGAKFIRNPITNPIGAFVGLLEMVAEFARLISFTFRLFGNMLAGEILLLVMTFLMPFLVALPFYGLEVFVGAIQGFVFFALTVAFGALAVESHDHEDHAEGEAHGEHAAAPAR